MTREEKNVMFEILKNPKSYGDETRREMAHKVMAELARLWRIEETARSVQSELAREVGESSLN